MGKDYYILLGTILTLFINFGCVSKQDDNEVNSILRQHHLNTQKGVVADIFLNNLFNRNNKGEDLQKIMLYYFGSQVEAVNVNGNWSPIFYYYIYQSKPGDYESYFNAYLVWRDEIIYSGKQRVYTQYGKVVYGEFSPEEEFTPDGKDDLIPMANITVSKKLGS